MVKGRITELNLPKFPYGATMEETKSKMTALLLEEEYGVLPNRETTLSWETVQEEEDFVAGKAIFRTVNLTAQFENGAFTFPVRAVIPKGKTNIPFFVHINFRPDVPDRYQPTEEIIDNGFAVLSFCYKEVTSDDADFSNGVSPFILGANEQVRGNDCGKIAMWAWAASRVLDYAESLPELDMHRAMVVGHSRLGKTALLTGALDARFALAISNDSGCSGAAITRGKQGERVEDICSRLGYWFCKNYDKYRGKEETMPFDQHFLLAAVAPQRVYVASAAEDLWADPDAEFLSCVLAGEYYEHYGLKGFVYNDSFPKTGEKLHSGNVAYHKRSGTHFFSREDWIYFMEYAKTI